MKRPKPPLLVLATANEHKVEEIRTILAPLLPQVDPTQIVSMSNYDVPSPTEDAPTFAGNALLKARAVSEASGLPALADDSGLSVDVMGGAPGIFSARWSGTHGDDKANTALLLAQLGDVRDEDRGAQFVCSAVVAFPDSEPVFAEGIVRGRICREPLGDGGFGYDPIFVPDGFEVTTAQMSANEKNAISHRCRALQKLAPLLAEVLAR